MNNFYFLLLATNIRRVALIFFLLFSCSLSGQIILPEGQISTVDLNASLEYLITDTPPAPRDGWQAYTPAKKVTTHGVLWLRIPLISAREYDWKSLLYLHDFQSVEANLVLPDGNIRPLGTTGIFHPLLERSVPFGSILYGIGNSVQLAVTIPPGESTLRLRVENTLEEVLSPQLQLVSPQHWNTKITAQRELYLLIQGGIGGALIIFGFYHLLIAFLRKSKPYFWYSIYCILMALILWHETGVLQAVIFTDQFLPLRLLQKNQTLGILGTIFYCIFLRSFIQLKLLLPRLDRFIIYCLVFVIVLGAPQLWAYITFKTIAVNNFIYLITLFTLLVSLVVFIPIYRSNDPYAKIAIYGSAALVTGVLLSTICSLILKLGWVTELPFPGVYFTEIGVIVELIIFAFGLGYRSNQEAKAKEQLEALAHLKSNFFTNITHEFRTPLTVIGGVADQISGHDRERELIRRNAGTLLKLVNELLDLALIDARAIKVQMQQADIIPYLRYLTESFHSMANDAAIDLQFVTEVDELLMDFDEDILQKIVSNLLSNALKFTDAGGTVSLNISSKDEELKLQVNDTGVGLHAEELARVFERYFQATSTNSHYQQGSGIGLSLTRELIHTLGGDISVASEAGKGTSFTVHLPITNQASITAVNKPNILPQATFSDRTASIHAATGEGPVILLVEDNADIVTYLSDLLGKVYTFHACKDGVAGLAMATELVPDLIISDVMMPRMDGFELCEKLKTNPATAHIPLILLTAKSTQADKIDGLTHGADDYLIKPFDKQELLLRIQNLLRRIKQQQAHYQARPFGASISEEKIDPVLEKILLLVEERLGDADLSVSEISETVQLGRTQINRKIKALTGYTTSGFISEQRLKKAAFLLQSSDLLVSEIAYSVGYADPNYFTRAFTKRFGYSPKALRSS